MDASDTDSSNPSTPREHRALRSLPGSPVSTACSSPAGSLPDNDTSPTATVTAGRKANSAGDKDIDMDRVADADADAEAEADARSLSLRQVESPLPSRIVLRLPDTGDIVGPHSLDMIDLDQAGRGGSGGGGVIVLDKVGDHDLEAVPPPCAAVGAAATRTVTAVSTGPETTTATATKTATTATSTVPAVGGTRDTRYVPGQPRSPPPSPRSIPHHAGDPRANAAMVHIPITHTLGHGITSDVYAGTLGAGGAPVAVKLSLPLVAAVHGAENDTCATTTSTSTVTTMTETATRTEGGTTTTTTTATTETATAEMESAQKTRSTGTTEPAAATTTAPPDPATFVTAGATGTATTTGTMTTGTTTTGTATTGTTTAGTTTTGTTATSATMTTTSTATTETTAGPTDSSGTATTTRRRPSTDRIAKLERCVRYELATEARLLSGPLADLQGEVVPRFYGVYRAWIPAKCILPASASPPPSSSSADCTQLQLPGGDSAPDTQLELWATLLQPTTPIPFHALTHADKLAVVRAYRHLHAAGVLHRDVSPRHWHRGADGRVVVIDFGLAQAREGVELGIMSAGELVSGGVGGVGGGETNDPAGEAGRGLFEALVHEEMFKVGHMLSV